MGWGMPGSSRHPRIRTPLALTLARWSLTRIVLAYVGLSVLLALALAPVLAAVSGDHRALTDAARWTFAAVWTAGAGLLQSQGQSVGYYVLAAVLTVVGVLLPLFLLGAFVFKLFQRDPLVWRSVVSVEDHPRGTVLAFRYYNGIDSPLVNITTVVLARFETSTSPSLRANRRLPVLHRDELRDSSFWAYGAPGVPFTFRVPLPAHDSADELCAGDVVALEGRSVARRSLELVVTATGTLTATGGTFVSTRVYSAARDLLPGRFSDVDVDDARPPRKWAGWDRFEENCDLYVFAYGSLVSPVSLARTLGHALHRTAGPHPAQLRSWRRAWNVGADASSHPSRRYVQADGQDFAGVVASLGLERHDEGTCSGAVFRVTLDELALLDDRERNYDRVEVTSEVDVDLGGRRVRTFTYVPKAEAVARLQTAVREDRAVVRAEYVQLCEQALSAVLPAGTAVQELPVPPCPVVPLRLEDAPEQPEQPQPALDASDAGNAAVAATGDAGREA